tara:strand:+ start:1368 stop:4037 length:2670 start_codon:yes stop_codon:yes gene_type:complete
MIRCTAKCFKTGKVVVGVYVLMVLTLLFGAVEVHAQADYKRFYDEDKLPKVREVYLKGGFELVIQICDYALRRGQPSWEWRTLRFQALASVGRYDEAAEEALATTQRFPDELGVLLRAYELFEDLGREDASAAMVEGINKAASAVPTQDRTARDYVDLGQAALALGADPAQVLEQYFGVAKAFQVKGKQVPDGMVEAFLVSGNLALEKDDFARAADEFREGLKFAPTHPDLLFGMAQAFMPNDRKAGVQFLEKVMEEAPFHFGAILLQAEHAINYEQYVEAKAKLDLVESINPQHPLAIAYRAVLAELEYNDGAAFEEARQKALAIWEGNPKIDYLIGRVLSRKYRYEEGARSQLRALEMDPEFLPSKLQLALDYLRLGQVEKAWPLAAEVGQADEYNVLAYNLEVLKKEIESFASVVTDDFIVRLPPNEAEIYGDRVVEILTEAKALLGAKYGLDIEEPTLVEFYPNQQDFAIRSFGSLGGEGLLGVCFGSVVTMNSPGGVTAGKNNWESTLWHEYCHVVTLTATKNKMPRWLSEGISVYEEIQRNPTWGQRMTPSYRRMILEEGALTPVSEMSQAFFQAKSGEHIMFAYYQSMLVVQFIVENYGIESLRSILSDLAEGILINDAVARNTVPMADLEESFLNSAVELAANYGDEVDWSRPEPEEVNPVSSLAVASYLKKNPSNYWARQTLTQHLVDAKRWEDVVASAGLMIELLPEFSGAGNGYVIKAQAFRELGNAAAEAEVLNVLASLSAEAMASYSRLLEVEFETENWDGVLVNADRSMAINPFLERIHYCRGCAAAALADTGDAVDSFEKSLMLAPANPSEVRFRLARLLESDDQGRSKRFLLDALADSPRYREAHAMLLDMADPPVDKADAVGRERDQLKGKR